MLLACVVGTGCGSTIPTDASGAYVAEIEEYRAAREERLRAEYGWLSLVGLFWLEPGANTLGSAPGSAVSLPEGAAPPAAGTFRYDRGVVRLEAAPDSGITLGGETVTSVDLEPNVEVRLGRLAFFVIERAGRHAIRVKDPQSPVRTDFGGLDHYPIDPSFRVEARLRRHASPREVEVATVTGSPARFLVPGVLEFELQGRPHALEPLISKPGESQLFLIFKDETSGRETYGAGRYLYATLEGDRAVVDFNKAYNPPCAFTPFATCPLPPGANRLESRIESGERAFAPAH